jgi:hypothetical protein
MTARPSELIDAKSLARACGLSHGLLVGYIGVVGCLSLSRSQENEVKKRNTTTGGKKKLKLTLGRPVQRPGETKEQAIERLAREILAALMGEK